MSGTAAGKREARMHGSVRVEERRMAPCPVAPRTQLMAAWISAIKPLMTTRRTAGPQRDHTNFRELRCICARGRQVRGCNCRRAAVPHLDAIHSGRSTGAARRSPRDRDRRIDEGTGLFRQPARRQNEHGKKTSQATIEGRPRRPSKERQNRRCGMTTGHERAAFEPALLIMHGQ